MPLALGRCEAFFVDDSARFLDDVDRTIRLALLDVGEAIVETIARNPQTPEDTGALKDSIRVAPPGYAQDDTPLVQRAGSGGNFLSLNRDSTRAPGATRDAALAGHRAARAAAGSPAPSRAGDEYELVQPTATGYATWIGSFLKYSFPVHQGFYHVGAGRQIAGRPYIARVALARFGADFPDAFRARWTGVRYRGA
jgi:hypothetical protein